jgi:hypothetical protein
MRINPNNPQKIGLATGAGLAASILVASALIFGGDYRESAKSAVFGAYVGSSEQSQDAIWKAGAERDRTRAAEHRGLSSDSTWEEILSYDQARTPVERITPERVKGALVIANDPAFFEQMWAEQLNKSDSTAEEQGPSSEQNRVEQAKKLGLPVDASWKQITAVVLEQTRSESVAKLGMPANATLQQIVRLDMEHSRIKGAVKRGLLADATWKQITDAVLNEDHAAEAAKRGLPADATLDEIIHFDLEQSRTKAAAERGLPAYASWEEISMYDLARS